MSSSRNVLEYQRTNAGALLSAQTAAEEGTSQDINPRSKFVEPLGEPKGTPGQGLLLATFGFCLGFAGLSIFGPTVGQLKDELDFSPMQRTILAAAPALSGSLLRIPFGASVDETGGKKPFFILLVLAACGLAGLAVLFHDIDALKGFSGTFPLMLFFGIMVGCGVAIFSVGIGMVSYWYPKTEQGKALGTYAGVGNLTPGIVAAVLPTALTQLGLFWTYAVWFGVITAGCAIYFVFGQNAPSFQLLRFGHDKAEAEALARSRYGQELFPQGLAIQSLKTASLSWKNWALVSFYFVGFGGFAALTTWLPGYWMEHHNVTKEVAGYLTMLYSTGSSLVRVGGGLVADKIGGELALLISMFVTLLGAVIMSMFQDFGPDVAGEVLLAIGMGVANAAVFKLVPQYVPEAVGGAAGWVGGLGGLGGFVLPPILTAIVVSPNGGYPMAWLVFVGLAFLSVAGAGAMKVLQARQQQKAQLATDKEIDGFESSSEDGEDEDDSEDEEEESSSEPGRFC